MTSLWSDRVRAGRIVWMVFAVIAGWAGTAVGSESGVVRIEEDWELVVSQPQTDSNSPQVTCAISPAGNDEPEYMAFELNFQSLPDYQVGGLHLHAWRGDYWIDSAHTQPAVQLRTDDEVVTWTQSVQLINGVLEYSVTNGSSTTWGSFGNGELHVVAPTTFTNLDKYNIAHSLRGSGVGFGRNRVASLTLKRVRLVTSSGTEFEYEVNQDVLDYEEQGSGGQE